MPVHNILIYLATLGVRVKQELRTLKYFDEEDKLTEDGFRVVRSFYKEA